MSTFNSSLRDMSEVLSFARKDPENTLVVLDIGYTLIKPSGPMLATAEGRRYLLSQFPISQAKTRLELIELATELATFVSYTPVEESTPNIVKTLQEEAIDVIAITGAGNHFIFGLPYFPKTGSPTQFQLYSNILKSTSIDLTKSCPLGKELQEVCEYLSAKYQEGILFTGGQPMANIVPHFISACAKKYKRLIVVDDELEYLEQLRISLQPYSIKFIGLHYMPNAKESNIFDKNLAETQLQAFQKTKRLSVDESSNRG